MEVNNNNKITVTLSNNNNLIKTPQHQQQQLNNQSQHQNGHHNINIPLTFIDSSKISSNNLNNTSSTDKTINITEIKKPIRLNSPVGASAISWHWSEKEKNNIGIEVLDIIRLALIHFPELASLKSKLECVDVFNYDQVRSLAKKFNKLSKETAQTRKENSTTKTAQNTNKELIHQIITRSYNRAVDNEKALNKHYEAFSSQTYGETSYERMQLIIDELKPTQKDVFVDLGSGVGQLVVHMAGATQVHRAVGIEIAQLPSKFAKKLEPEFKKLMNWFGRPFQQFELIQGDFLNPEYRKLITEEASIIFINNYAFQSDLETRIKRELLADLKDGTKIVSTKPYVPLNKQGAITDRQLNDISVITEVTEMKPCPNPCSWTSAYVPYYLHTINRTKLENYFLKLRNSSLRAKSSDTGSRRSSTPNSSSKTSTNSRESSVCCIRTCSSRDEKTFENSNNKDGGNGGGRNKDYEEDLCYGPTTRRKWNDYVNEMEQQKRRQSSCSSSNGGGGSGSGNSSEKIAASNAVNKIKNNNLNKTTINNSSTNITTLNNNNNVSSKIIKIVKNLNEKIDENENNLTIPKLRLSQTTIKNAENNDQNIIKINNNHQEEEIIENDEKLNETEAMEINCNNIEEMQHDTTLKSFETTNETTMLEENTKIIEMNINTNNDKNNNVGLVSPCFEPISPDKTTPTTNNINVSNVSVSSNISNKRTSSGKRSYERKERVNSFSSKGGRGRPRKSIDSSNNLLGGGGGLQHHYSSPKIPRLSEDARDGMELMHQMTCAIQMGKPMDAASFLADLANQKASSRQQQQQNDQQISCLNNNETPKGTLTNLKTFNKSTKTTIDSFLPFPQLNLLEENCENVGNNNNIVSGCNSSKYPQLNNFLDAIRNAYENFFDEFHSNNSIKNSENVLKQDEQHQQIQQHPLKSPIKTSKNENKKFENFPQFRSILDSTPLKLAFPEGDIKEENNLQHHEEDDEIIRKRFSSLGEEMFYSAESNRQRVFSCSGGSETNNNNNNFNKTPTKTSMLQKNKIQQQQQTPKNTPTTLFNKGIGLNKQQTEKLGSSQRLQELYKRVEERRKWLLNAWTEFQREMQLFNSDLDCLVNECSIQQQEGDSNTQQQIQRQQQIIQLVAQQQAQQQLIEAAQQQLAVQVQHAQQQQQQAAVAVAASAAVLNNNCSPTNVQQQQQQSSSNVNQATVSNQLDLLINEMRERYSQQLTAQHLLSQITQFGLLNTIAPQEIAALQSIASGAALNNVVHQLSPVAACAAAVVLQQQQQQLSPLSATASQPSIVPQQQNLLQQTSSPPSTCLIPQNVTAPFVQNFLASLDNLQQQQTTIDNNNSDCIIGGTIGGVLNNSSHNNGSTLNLNSSSISGDIVGGNNSSSISLNSSITSTKNLNNNNQRQNKQQTLSSTTTTPIGLSLQQQVNQNFICQQPQQNNLNNKKSLTVSHSITRESTVAEVVAEVAALPSSPRKPFKPRPTRNINGTSNGSSNSNAKRTTQHSNKHSQHIDDPKKQEEIERQIQDIVAKALEVDSAAKSAEKERKTRVGEKRNLKEQQRLTTSTTNNLSSIPTTSSSIDNIGKFAPLSSRNVAQNNSMDFQMKADNTLMQNFLSAAVAASQQQQQQTSDTSTNFSDNEHFRIGISSSKSTILTPKIENIVVSPTTTNLQQQQHLNFNFTPSSVSLAIQGVYPTTISIADNNSSNNVFASVSSPSTNMFSGENTNQNNICVSTNLNKNTNNMFGENTNSNNKNQNKNKTNNNNPNKNVNFFSSDVLDSSSLQHKQQTSSTTNNLSPPFISLNLPPNTCCNNLPPPTNVVVKVESKQPLIQNKQQPS